MKRYEVKEYSGPRNNHIISFIPYQDWDQEVRDLEKYYNSILFLEDNALFNDQLQLW